MRYHVTQMTPEAAMEHARRVHGIADKPEIGLGWTPYNFYVTDRAVSAWATHTEIEFESRRIADRLTAPAWGPWRDGVRGAWMDVKPTLDLDDQIEDFTGFSFRNEAAK
jgi:hypothetical protein